LLVCLL